MSKIVLQGNNAGTGTFTIQPPATNVNREFTLPDVGGTLAVTEQFHSPIGSIIFVTGTSAPGGYVEASGQLLDRTAYASLWAYAQSSGNISVDDASWTEGQYSPGDGSTTFRVPKVDDRFIRGRSATRTVGLVEEDAIRNITGELWAKVGTSIGFDGAKTGAFFNKTTTNGIAQSIDGYTGWSAGFDASRVVPTANENRPKALTMLPCIKAYDVISDPNVLNAVEVVNSVNAKVDKADLNAPGAAPMYACRAWVNFNGTTTPPTIRASGNVSSVVRNATGTFTVNFTTAMPDDNYSAIGSSGDFNRDVGLFGISSTSCTIIIRYSSSDSDYERNSSVVALAFFR